LVSLHVNSLASAAALSIKHVRQKLRNLPTTLSETYQAAMQRIKDQESDHRDIAFKTLAWLTYAFRSLSLRELQHALAIEPGNVELDEELVMDGQSITALCAGLVIVDQGTNVVNLVHYTTKKYFEETRSTYFPDFHASITLSCATYLALDALKDADIWELVQRFPLACYAAQYMADHARQTPEESLEPSVLEVLCQLLSNPDKRKPLLSLLDGLALIQSGFYSSNKSAAQIKEEAENCDAESEMRALFETTPNVGCSTEAPTRAREDEVEDANTRERPLSISTMADGSVDTSTDSRCNESDNVLWDTKLGATRIPEVTALHLAASMGLAKVASMLLGATSNIDAMDETGKTPLAVAMERGFEKAVEFLLNSGACVDLHHGHGRAVLLLVTERSWHKAGEIITGKAKSLLKDPAATHADDGVSFLLAAYEGKIDEIERLFEWSNISEDANHDIGAMTLFLAVEREDLNMVQTLLSLGLNPNTKDNTGQASLHRATRRANEAMIKLLLERGAEIDCKDDDGRTPWSANVRMADKHVLKVLLDAGADPSTRGLQGVSELYTAAKDGEVDCVKYMLECGTDPSIKTNYDWTPLHWASADGYIECVKLLLAAGANPSALSDQNVTPLDLALQANQAVSIELLTKAGGRQGKDLGEWKGQWADAARSTQRKESIVASTEKKLTLVFDKPLNRAIVRGTAVGQYIYPFNTLSSEAEGLIYQISHVLETSISSMSIRRSKTRPTMFEYPLKLEDFHREDVIYDIHRVTLDYQEFDLQPKGKDLLPGNINMHREWTGGWKVHHNHEDKSTYLFRVTPDWSRTREEECRWMTESGQLLARTGWEDKTPNIRFDHGIDRQMRDILVSCWVTKLWFETVTG
jgi:ankyrin repeat protein